MTATMEDAVFALVTTDPAFEAQAGARLYAADLPQAPAFPCATYFVASRLHHYHMEGSTNLRKARVQFDAYGRDYDEAVALADTIRARVEAYRGQVPVEGAEPVDVQGIFCIMDRDVPESGTRTSGPRIRRRLLEFTVWV